MQPASVAMSNGASEFNSRPNQFHFSGYIFILIIKSSVVEFTISCKSLSFKAAKVLVNSFVISRIDYCNVLLAGIPRCAVDRLQRVINNVARSCSAGKYSVCQA